MKYSKLSKVYEKLEKTTKRLEKTYIISEFLKEIDEKDIEIVMLLLQGKVFHNYESQKIGVATKNVLKALSRSVGVPVHKIEEEWKKLGDIGEVAKKLVGSNKSGTLADFGASSVKDLSVKKVFKSITKLSMLEGERSVAIKQDIIVELLSAATPDEAKYIIRTVLEDLRVGAGEGSLRDAIVWANYSKEVGFSYKSEENNFDVENREKYNEYTSILQRAYDLTNDFSEVAKKARKGIEELKKVEINVGTPIKAMLGPKELTVQNALKRVGIPAVAEYKFDGFRMQIHKNKDKISLFTRNLEDVTRQFPEVIDYVKENVKGENFILDSEAVGFEKKSGKYLSFQNISQRIKRKYDIEKVSKELPVEVVVFDVIFHDNKNMIDTEFSERRKLLESIIIQKEKKIVLSKNMISENESDFIKFFEESIKEGNEGLMLKRLDAPYKPGSRVGHWVKLKSEMDPLDLVITAAEWGEGKRANWFSSFTLACIDDNGEFLEIGKVGTGIKEKSEEEVTFEQLTKEIEPHIISEKGKDVKVKPKVVVEIVYEEIQKSPTYSSGYALRFPRIKRLRVEKDVQEIASIDMVEDEYFAQKKS